MRSGDPRNHPDGEAYRDPLNVQDEREGPAPVRRCGWPTRRSRGGSSRNGVGIGQIFKPLRSHVLSQLPIAEGTMSFWRSDTLGKGEHGRAKQK